MGEVAIGGGVQVWGVEKRVAVEMGQFAQGVQGGNGWMKEWKGML